jgi:anti-sigma regulatory factor (Ser/Thr protein kinase)
VREARHRLDALLYVWGLGTEVHDDAVLVLSELVTNALIHTRGAEIACQVWATTEMLCLAVADHGYGATQPHVRGADTDAASGRGLVLVDALTDQWGVLPGTDGRVVWAAFPIVARVA